MNVDRMTASATASGASASAGWLRALEMTKPIANQQTRVLPVIIDELAEKFGHKPALLGEKQCLTFRALADRSNRYARWAIGQDLAKQDVVCLLMPNCPEYMAIWLGIARVGGIVALLNTKLVGASLAGANLAGANLSGSHANSSERRELRWYQETRRRPRHPLRSRLAWDANAPARLAPVRS